MAFLDIMPLTPGHVLVAPRRHYEMLGDMGVQAGQEVCILLFLFLLTICLALVLPVLCFSSVVFDLIFTDSLHRWGNGFPLSQEL